MTIEKSTKPECADEHYSHIRAILSPTALFTVGDIQAQWPNVQFAIHGAECHAEALYEICEQAEMENAQLRAELKALKENRT